MERKKEREKGFSRSDFYTFFKQTGAIGWGGGVNRCVFFLILEVCCAQSTRSPFSWWSYLPSSSLSSLSGDAVPAEHRHSEQENLGHHERKNSAQEDHRHSFITFTLLGLFVGGGIDRSIQNGNKWHALQLCILTG